MNLTDYALSEIKAHISDRIAYAEYEEPNGVSTQVDIAEKIITEDGTLGFLVRACIDRNTIMLILRLRDSDGKCWLSQYCDIRLNTNEVIEVPIWFYFKIEEEM